MQLEATTTSASIEAKLQSLNQESEDNKVSIPDRNTSLDEELEGVVKQIAQTGRILYDWALLRRLFRVKIYQQLESMFANHGFIGPVTQTFDSRRQEILDLLARFDYPPFTVQRLAEVLSTDANQYKSTHKFMNSLEKILSVISSLEMKTDNSTAMVI
jgi:hypothetical protein